ncbi:hypothetical protein [Mesorhizobium sophorae]|uniref:hypothetical protein n=1 Tax=Mesorhizobium sophorae TaxID=1300294 RepID=UPI00198144EF|nr:hypothetical protein [Mesorhizobium sophorae]
MRDRLLIDVERHLAQGFELFGDPFLDELDADNVLAQLGRFDNQPLFGRDAEEVVDLEQLATLDE